MIKDAYLIMAHDNWSVLYNQLLCLDADYNDFYIHIDGKVDAGIKTRVENTIRCILKKSCVIFLNSINVTWGGILKLKRKWH